MYIGVLSWGPEMEACYSMMWPIRRSDGDCNAQGSPLGAAVLCGLW